MLIPITHQHPRNICPPHQKGHMMVLPGMESVLPDDFLFFRNQPTLVLISFCSPTKGPRMSKTGKRIGRPPKKGTLLPNSSLGSMVSSEPSSSMESSSKVVNSPASSPEPEEYSAKRRKTLSSKRYLHSN